MASIVTALLRSTLDEIFDDFSSVSMQPRLSASLSLSLSPSPHPADAGRHQKSMSLSILKGTATLENVSIKPFFVQQILGMPQLRVSLSVSTPPSER